MLSECLWIDENIHVTQTETHRRDSDNFVKYVKVIFTSTQIFFFSIFFNCLGQKVASCDFFDQFNIKYKQNEKPFLVKLGVASMANECWQAEDRPRRTFTTLRPRDYYLPK